MKRVSSLINSFICGAAFVVALTNITEAATGNNASYSSQGRIVFDGNTVSTADDVVFDASDFATIDNAITSGKKEIIDAINSYRTINLLDTTSSYSHAALASAIETITDDTDVLSENVLAGKTYYAKGNKGTGTMNNNGGATVEANTITEDGDNALIDIPAAGYYSDLSKLSVPIETIKKNIDIGKPEFAYDPVYKGNYNSNVHTISVNKDKYYMAVFRDANGAGRCNISKLTIDNVTITKSMGDSTNNVAIFWFKTNGTTITVSGTTDAVAVFFVSELSNNPEYVKEFTSITYVARGFDHQTFTVPCNKYAMIISIGYQGTQSLSMTLTGESYNQEGFKSIKAYANHTGLNNCGYAHLICESSVDFEVVLCQRNNNLIYLS